MKEHMEFLLGLPDSWLDNAMKPLIQRWDAVPKAIQVLEVLDRCINGALANGNIIVLLQCLYKDACDREGVTHETVVLDAIWRKPATKQEE